MYRIIRKIENITVDLNTIDQLIACVIMLADAEFVYHKLHLSDTTVESIQPEIFEKLRVMHGGDVMIYMNSLGLFHREPDSLVERARLVEGFCLEILEATYYDVTYEQNCFSLGMAKKGRLNLNNVLYQ